MEVCTDRFTERNMKYCTLIVTEVTTKDTSPITRGRRNLVGQFKLKEYVLPGSRRASRLICKLHDEGQVSVSYWKTHAEKEIGLLLLQETKARSEKVLSD